jgi:DNA polymerase
MDLYTIDAETFYSKEFSLSRLTTEEYVRDPRFELIGLSIKKNDKKTKWLSGDILEIYAALHTIDWSNAAILAHNTLFDGAILAWRLGIKPKLWLDTLSMSRAIHGPDAPHSLAALAKRYKLPPKGDEVLRAMGMQRADFTPAQLAAYGDYCKHDTDLCYQLFNIFVGHVPKKELQLIDMTLRMFTEPQLQLNKPKLEAHLIETVRAKQALLYRVGADKKDLMSNDKFAGLLQDMGVDPPRKVSATTGKEAWAFAKTDEEFKALLEHDDPDVQALVAARLGNKSTLEETRTARFIGIADRGMFPVPLRYYGAHTGRWSGQDSVNLQNLPSRGPNAKKIKSTIEAPPGYVIIEADSSQIEARVLAWLAEQADMLQTFRDKEDPYKKMAVPIYGVLEADVTKDQRQVGKGVVLGCGFGMGPDKFQGTMKGTYDIPLELDECQRIVKIYRAANPRIVKLWKDAGHMLTYMTRETAYHFGKPGVLGVEPDRFGIRLPSGLYVQYPDLQGHQTERGWQFDYAGRGTSRKKVYGALVIENVTQALARIIVAEQMLQIKKEYPIALTVHDSALIVVPKAEEETAKAYVEDCMRWLPKWAKGLPVDCEAGSAQNYGDT